jgi:hypothetical protein
VAIRIFEVEIRAVCGELKRVIGITDNTMVRFYSVFNLNKRRTPLPSSPHIFGVRRFVSTQLFWQSHPVWSHCACWRTSSTSTANLSASQSLATVSPALSTG